MRKNNRPAEALFHKTIKITVAEQATLRFMK